MKARLLIIALAFSATLRAPAQERTIQFSGYEWVVRNGGEEKGGPGPNLWDGNNVRVDEQGRLHLKLTKRGATWYCAEVSTKKKLGFGLYEFQITGRVDKLDQNVVLGFFNYPEPGDGTDGTNEIDIEYAKWRRPDANICNYTVYPPQKGPVQSEKNFKVALHEDGLSTQRFVWTSQVVFFQSLHGHLSGPRNDGDVAASWLFQPVDFLKRVGQKPMPVHINLWCCDGYAPKDGREVEIVVDAFKFTTK